MIIAPVGCDRGHDGARHAPSSSLEPPAYGDVAAREFADAASAMGAPCGELDCRVYGDARAAFARVLALDPRVLGVGEVHAPRNAVARSAAARFADELLPLLAGRASDLLLELMQPPAACTDAASHARAAERPVTSRQSATAQSEYVTMGERARALGIVPDVLRPTCADIAVIAAGNADTGAERWVDAALSVTARLAAAQARRAVLRDDETDADRGKVVVLYGGALHNDLPPPRGGGLHEPQWSYAEELDAATGGRFVAVDLIVPEFIGDDAVWRAFPWWRGYERGVRPRRRVLRRRRPTRPSPTRTPPAAVSRPVARFSSGPEARASCSSSRSRARARFLDNDDARGGRARAADSGGRARGTKSAKAADSVRVIAQRGPSCYLAELLRHGLRRSSESARAHRHHHGWQRSLGAAPRPTPRGRAPGGGERGEANGAGGTPARPSRPDPVRVQ